MSQHAVAHQWFRRTWCRAAVVAGAVLAAACTQQAPLVHNESQVTQHGKLVPPQRADDAFSYDHRLAPIGAELAVTGEESGGSTTMRISADGLLPNRGYAAHAHVHACGATGAAAGPHFQHRLDPAATPQRPSADPAYANPGNEIWLDLRTDARGHGRSSTEVPFTMHDRAPGSLIVHEATHTRTGPGTAGTAGGRAACLNLHRP